MLGYKLSTKGVHCHASSPEKFNEEYAVCPELKRRRQVSYSTDMLLPYGKQAAFTLHIIILIVHDIPHFEMNDVAFEGGTAVV